MPRKLLREKDRKIKMENVFFLVLAENRNPTKNKQMHEKKLCNDKRVKGEYNGNKRTHPNSKRK